MKSWVLVACMVVSACQKKEEEAPAPSAAPPPPAVSVAPVKEPEPVPAPTPAASEAPVAAASAAPAAVTAAAKAPAAPVGSSEGKAEAKKGPGGDLTACCAAIGAAALKGGSTKNKYVSAAAVCTGLNGAIRAGKANLASAKITMKAQLAGVPVPNGC